MTNSIPNLTKIERSMKMKANRLFPIAFVFSLLLTACTPTPTVEITPTVEPTEIDTPLAATLTPTVDSQHSIVTTPLPVSTRTPRPPTPVPALTSLPDDVGSNACPDTQPSLLMPGRQGRVSNATPDPNRVRAEPNAQAEMLGEIPAGAYFDVLEGPTCADDGAWFKVRYETMEGWMKEGSSTEYWVMPIVADARTLTGPDHRGSRIHPQPACGAGYHCRRSRMCPSTLLKTSPR